MANIFRTASLWLKVALGFMALGLLLFVIGFATKSWVVRPRDHRYSAGLWAGCGPSYCATLSPLNDYHRAIQAMECIGLIGFILAILTLLLYFVLDTCRRRDFLQADILFTFAGLTFACIGFAIYGSRDNMNNDFGRGRDIGWSMGIAIAGAVAYGIAGVMLILQLIAR